MLESNVDQTNRNATNAIINNTESITNHQNKDNGASGNDSCDIENRVIEDISDKMKNAKILVDENLEDPQGQEIRAGSNSAVQANITDKKEIKEVNREVDGGGIISPKSDKLENLDSKNAMIKNSNPSGTVPCISPDKEDVKNTKSRSSRNIEETNKTVVKSPSWQCYKTNEGDSCVMN